MNKCYVKKIISKKIIYLLCAISIFAPTHTVETDQTSNENETSYIENIEATCTKIIEQNTSLASALETLQKDYDLQIATLIELVVTNTNLYNQLTQIRNTHTELKAQLVKILQTKQPAANNAISKAPIEAEHTYMETATTSRADYVAPTYITHAQESIRQAEAVLAISVTLSSDNIEYVQSMKENIREFLANNQTLINNILAIDNQYSAKTHEAEVICQQNIVFSTQLDDMKQKTASLRANLFEANQRKY